MILIIIVPACANNRSRIPKRLFAYTPMTIRVYTNDHSPYRKFRDAKNLGCTVGAWWVHGFSLVVHPINIRYTDSFLKRVHGGALFFVFNLYT